MPAGVVDGHRRLGREEHQRLLILPRELPVARRMSQIDRADPDPLVADRSDQQGLHRHRGQEPGHVQRPQVAVDVRDPQGLLEPVEILGESRSLQHVPQTLVLLPGETGDDGVGSLSAFVKNGYRPVARGRQRLGAVHYLLQHRVEVEALVDAEAGPAQAREAIFQFMYPSE